MDLIIKYYLKFRPIIVIAGIVLFIFEPIIALFTAQQVVYSLRLIEGLALGTCVAAFQDQERQRKNMDKLMKEYAKKHPEMAKTYEKRP